MNIDAPNILNKLRLLGQLNVDPTLGYASVEYTKDTEIVYIPPESKSVLLHECLVPRNLIVVGGSGLETLATMFSYNTYKEIDLRYLDTSNAKSMVGTFSDCTADSVDLSGLDLSKIEDMTRMFDHAKIGKINISNNTCRNVRCMSCMFFGASIDELTLGDFNTSGCGLFLGMFKLFETEGSLDFSKFDTKNALDMQSMFSEACINKIDLRSFEFSKLHNIKHMFYGVNTNEINLDSPGWDLNGNVLTSKMFNGIEDEILVCPKEYAVINHAWQRRNNYDSSMK